jgi:GT2 family glycosyltransferase
MADPQRSQGRTSAAQLLLTDAQSASAQQADVTASRPVIAELQFDGQGRLSGWALDPGDRDRRFVVEILGDGGSLAIVKADRHVDALVREGHGDGCYGFAIATNPRFQIASYELLLANDERVIAHCSGAVSGAAPAALSSGSVLWRGGLRLSGTIREPRGGIAGPSPVQVYDGSRRLAATLRFYPGEADGDREQQFDLVLPAELADGHPHRLRVMNAVGVELGGSPVAILANRAGFQELATAFGQRGRGADESVRQRLEFLDQLVPASLPFESYPIWSRDFADQDAFDDVASTLALGVIILGCDGSEATLASLRRQRGDFSIRAAIIDVESVDRPRFTPADWCAACSGLAATAPAATLVIRAGAVLKPFACLALASAFDHANKTEERARLYVGDHELLSPDGTSVPFLGPTFDYERLLSQGYAEGFFAVSHLPEIPGNPAELVNGHDVLFAALEAAQAKHGRIIQIPRVLASVPRLGTRAASADLAAAVRRHLARSGQEAVVEAGQGSQFPLVHVRRPRPEGEVAIIIPTRDRLDLLKPCLASIRERTAHPDYRLVIVDNGSREQETLDYFHELSRQGALVLRDDRAFNYARLNNLAIREIASPFACLLNNDVEVLAMDWLSEMQSFFSRESVGGVGAKLAWPNGMLQHGGVVLGMNFAAGHAYDRYLAEEPGYADGVLAARECSALTAACLLLRREDFLRVGGFDETAFPVAFNDVDLCLKLREAGKTLVWSPRAQLLHRESASRASDREMPAKQARFEKELAELRRRWSHRLVADDCYNPNLNLDAYSFTGLALPPRDRALRVKPVRF